ncbi:unnamed protein product [Spirodela intermedia]|uniref:Uncharacterized protein n=1 Tax=Spirodela intermedia TaxID=51605 RepID=A0A7I8LBF1_SPIIN|nr:unnamed protein product [Spirodela intermedia]
MCQVVKQASEAWDKLKVIYEGTSQVKYIKIGILVSSSLLPSLEFHKSFAQKRNSNFKREPYLCHFHFAQHDCRR